MNDNKRIYSRSELLDLVNKEHTCITLKHCNRKIELQAKYLKNVQGGIKDAMEKGLNKFDYSLSGILLDYRNLNVLADNLSGRIVGRFGEFLVTVNAEFFVFDPKIGSLLEGVVNAKSNTHVGCLVHKRFNAMILKPDAEENWNCENIQIGDKIVFTIVDHVFSGHIPHIEGVLATEYKTNSPEKIKGKSKLLGDQTQKLKENGEFSNEQVAFTQGNKRTNKLDEVDSSNTSFKKVQEGDLTNILGDKSPKSKSKKKNMSTDNLMDNGESLLEVKKGKKKEKKKKHKEDDKTKTDNILETEPIAGPSCVNLTLKEKPASENVENISMTIDDESVKIGKKKKRKKDKSLEVEGSVVHEKKKKTKKNEKKELENVDESIRKPKKKKRDMDVLKKAEKSENSPSKKRNIADVNTDTNEDNEDPVELIDGLMNFKPTIVIRDDVESPVKGTSLKNEKSPKRLKLEEGNKKETPKKSQSPSKKKRENSFVEDLEISPSKKRRLNESVKSSKSKEPHEKSLFSDSEASASSPMKTLPNRALPDVGSSQDEFGVANDATESGEVPTPSTSKKSKEKQKKPKRDKVQSNPDEKKSRKKSHASKQGAESSSSKIQSPVDGKQKKDLDSRKSNSVNKSVTSNAESVSSTAPVAETSLLQRFKTCLEKDRTETMDTSSGETTKKTPRKEKPNKNVNSLSKAREKVKKSETVKQPTQSENGVAQDEQPSSSSKKLSLGSGDVTEMPSPLLASTPRGTGAKSANNVKDGGKSMDKASLIKMLMKDVQESVGLPATNAEGKRKSGSSQLSIKNWLKSDENKKSSQN